MAESNTPATKTATKVSLASVTLIGALTALPAPYSQWVEYALAACGGVGIVATFIPAPQAGSKLWPVYRVLSFLAANWGQAVNAAMAMRSATKPSSMDK